MNGNGYAYECSTSTAPDLTDPEAEKSAASTVSTMIPAAAPVAPVAVGKGAMDMDAHDDGIPNDAEQIAAWATRQLTSPVHLQSLRVVYDALVDRQHSKNQSQLKQQQQHDQQPTQQSCLIRSLRLTCRLLLEINRQEQPHQQLLTTSQQQCIATTEQRCRWLLEPYGDPAVQVSAADANANADARNSLPVVPVVGSNSDQADDIVITKLCCRLRHSSPDTDTDTSIHPTFKPGQTEWTYDYTSAKANNNGDNEEDENDGLLPTRAQLAAESQMLWDMPRHKNDNDTADEHDDDDDDDDGGNMLPSLAELASEERMLWRMADTPIPSIDDK
jgi:hypothetical protein